MSVSVKAFLNRVEEICAEEPSYRIGGTAVDGTCDCIGLIVGAIRRAGGSWTGMKGCNHAARYDVRRLDKIVNSGDLTIGEVVFKVHLPGENGYDANTINNSYKSSPDKKDYYHIGVVTSVTPLRIRHMTTPKPKLDTSLGKWEYHGWLTKISGSGGEQAMTEKVIIQGGNTNMTINMRLGAGKNYPIIYDIPQGSEGDLIEWTNDKKWGHVQVNSRTGYVQADFIRSSSTPVIPPEQTTGDNVTIPKADLERIYDTLGDWLGLRG